MNLALVRHTQCNLLWAEGYATLHDTRDEAMAMRFESSEVERRRIEEDGRELPGIVIHDRDVEPGLRPRVSAFIWGGKVKPTPRLPFGEARGAA